MAQIYKKPQVLWINTLFPVLHSLFQWQQNNKVEPIFLISRSGRETPAAQWLRQGHPGHREVLRGQVSML